MTDNHEVRPDGRFEKKRIKYMSNILVTEGSGFIGSNLTEELLEKGHQVTVLDYFATGKIENSLPLLDKFPTKRTLQVGNIR